MSNVNRELENSATPPPPVREETTDEAQDEVMAATSEDGRPPSHGLRRREWGWFAVVASLAAVSLGAWALVSRMEWSTMWAALALGVGFLVLASPVIIAGRMRAREQRAAHETATHEVDRPPA